MNEEDLFKTEAKHGVVKGRQSSKGFSSQARRLPPKTNRLKQNEKTKSIPKSQQKDANDAKLTKPQTTRKGQASEDAGYVTKDQLSRILLSLTSADVQALHSHDLPAGHGQHSQRTVESTEQQTAVYQPSLRENQERTESKTKHMLEGTVANQDQVNVSKKNFQWKKELDEQIAAKEAERAKRYLSLNKNELEEYDPWGRPGGGAPIRTQSGNVVADYKKMHQDLSSTSDTNMPSVSAFDLRSKHLMTTTTESLNTHDVITTTTPLAMRSSFAVGAPGVVKYETYQSKIDEKKKWLQELEQQIKEKNERQAQEKLQQLQKEAKEESWSRTPVISNESPSGPTLASNVVATKHESSATVTSSVTATKRESPLNAAASDVLENSFRAGNVHARGHGLQSLGDMNQDELDRKRLKTLEHQRAIKEQYRGELKLREEKEEEARHRAEALQLSILQAHESAQQEKAAKRIKHLELGGHDVSGLISPGLGLVQQHIDTNTSPHNKEVDVSTAGYNQTSPRGTQHSQVTTETEHGTAMRHQKDASFESELKELSLKMSLESEWTTSSPVYSVRNNSQAKSHLKSSLSPVSGAGHIKTRSQSERSQRKKQTSKQRNKRQSSLDSRHPSEETAPVPPPLEDAFMIPYTRTSSATLSAVPGTPLSLQSDNVGSRKDPASVNRSKPTLKKPQSVVIPPQAHRTTVSSLSQKTQLGRQAVRKDNVAEKTSDTPRGRQRLAKQEPKKGDLSRTTAIRKDKRGKEITQEQRAGQVYAMQSSPTERLPTARQEMILQQLAALRQGLMMKERELHHGVL
ncbi:hypothetical protein ACROYT_G019248 [Oculina patagonica]